MVYCPYTDKELDENAVNSEHIIPLSLGGVNGLEIPVCKEFNARIGSEVDAKIGQELIIQSRRTKLKVKGHSRKMPSMYYKNAEDVDTELPLQMKITKDDGIKFRAPYVPDGSDHPTGRNIRFSTNIDMEIWLRYTAKVALSSGYFCYGDEFRSNVNTKELRAIMTMSHDEIRTQMPDIKAHAHYMLMGEESNEIRVYKHICEAIGEHSCIGIVPSDNHLTFFAGILGGYIGMIRVEANTKNFPNAGVYYWGHFMAPQNGQLNRVSYRKLLQKLITPETNNSKHSDSENAAGV